MSQPLSNPTQDHDTTASDRAPQGTGAAPAPSATDPASPSAAEAMRDIGEVPAVELITTAALHLMSAAAVKCGLGTDEAQLGHQDLDEARKLINALAGLVTAAQPEVGSQHAKLLKEGLRQVQLAFREASPLPDAPGQAPGERLTGLVS